MLKTEDIITGLNVSLLDSDVPYKLKYSVYALKNKCDGFEINSMLSIVSLYELQIE